jgi:hypothetical protein
MSRFYDIFMMMTIVGLSISLVNASGVFNINFGSLPQNNDIGYTTADVTNLTASQAGMKVQDQYQTTLKEPEMGLDIIGTMVSMVYVYPLIVDKLHGPAIIGVFVQALVTITQVAFLAQVFMRFGWKMVDS